MYLLEVHTETTFVWKCQSYFLENDESVGGLESKQLDGVLQVVF